MSKKQSIGKHHTKHDNIPELNTFNDEKEELAGLISRQARYKQTWQQTNKSNAEKAIKDGHQQIECRSKDNKSDFFASFLISFVF